MSSNKQFYKIQSDGTLYAVKQNDIYKGVGVSNLDLYLTNHIDEANAEGLYEMSDVQSEVPAFDVETETLSVSYTVQDNKIKTIYTISNI